MNTNPNDEFSKNSSKSIGRQTSFLSWSKSWSFGSIRRRSAVELTPEQTTHRLMLNRDWAKHKQRQHQQEITFISRALKSQENALEQLKVESEHLHEQAIQVRKASE